MKHAWISVLAGAVAFPTAVLGGPQFTAQDIIDHFATTKKTQTRGAVVVGDPNAPQERGVFIGATGFGNEASATSAAAATSTAGASAPLVIPKTGTGVATSGTSVAATGAATSGQAKASSGSSYAAAAPAPQASDAYDLLVTFRLGSDELTSQARENLDQFVVALASPELADLTFAVDGHTDATGTARFNLALSERRAASVVQYLTSRGVPVNRLVATGYGETRPLRSDPFDPINRRVETRRIQPGIACRATRC